MLEECAMFLLSNKTSKAAIKEINSSPKQEDDESLSRSDNSKISEHEENKKTILDEFEKFIEDVPFLPTFQNSHHMLSLTFNLLRIV